MALTVAKAEIDGRALWITVQADTIEEIHSLQARNVAWEERVKHGFAEGGIEAYGGAYAIDKTKKELPSTANEIQALAGSPNLAYQRVYKIVRAL